MSKKRDLPPAPEVPPRASDPFAGMGDDTLGEHLQVILDDFTDIMRYCASEGHFELVSRWATLGQTLKHLIPATKKFLGGDLNAIAWPLRDPMNESPGSAPDTGTEQ